MIEDVTRIICGLVRTVMEMPANSVRPSDQKAPTGGQTKEFATVKIISARLAGHPGSSYVNAGDDLTERVDAVHVMSVSVQFFRSPQADAAGLAKYSRAAFDKAVRLRQRLHMAAHVELMRTLGLGLLDVGEARDLTTVVDASYESRGQIDLTFNVVHRETAAIKSIATVPVDLAVQPPDGPEQTRAFEVTS